MLRINDTTITLKHFTDGALDISMPLICNPQNNEDVIISWYFESNEELVALIYITQHLREHGNERIHLYMPYIPNARQDRVKEDSDVFTLKYFANTINWLNFASVSVLDAHSRVSAALINRIVQLDVSQHIRNAIRSIPKSQRLVLCFPDEGSSKRYPELNHEYVFGFKKRNWKTRKIESFTLMGATESLNGANVLIVDDICSKGDTALSAAKAAKEAGAKNIYLYITHCEETMLNNIELMSIVSNVYTTRSIFLKSDPRVQIV